MLKPCNVRNLSCSESMTSSYSSSSQESLDNYPINEKKAYSSKVFNSKNQTESSEDDCEYRPPQLHETNSEDCDSVDTNSEECIDESSEDKGSDIEDNANTSSEYMENNNTRGHPESSENSDKDFIQSSGVSGSECSSTYDEVLSKDE